MPVYEFECKACGKMFDHLFPNMRTENLKVKCPHCESVRTQRKLSVFAVKSGSASSGGAGTGGGRCGCGNMPGSCSMN